MRLVGGAEAADRRFASSEGSGQWSAVRSGRGTRKRFVRRRSVSKKYGTDDRTVEAVWRSYAEPVAKDATASTSLAATARPTAADEPLPLPQGTLTDNVGLSIVCVCTKVPVVSTLPSQ